MEDETKNYYILGIDEAGRGPVLGPMVYACALWKASDEDSLNSTYKFDDSKKLTDKIRRQMFEQIKNDSRIKYYFNIHTPIELSNTMIRRPKDIINLNETSHSSAASLINKALMDDYDVQEVFADTVGPKSSYMNVLKAKCIKKSGIEIIAEEKADSKYKVVSAASIVAKVTRDLIIEEWEFRENNGVIKFSTSMGSGYPADPYTKAWLKGNFHEIFGYPSIVRFSWKTVTKVIFADGKKTLFKDYVDEPDGKKRDKFIKDSEKKDKKKNAGPKSYSYLRNRAILTRSNEYLFE